MEAASCRCFARHRSSGLSGFEIFPSCVFFCAGWLRSQDKHLPFCLVLFQDLWTTADLWWTFPQLDMHLFQSCVIILDFEGKTPKGKHPEVSSSEGQKDLFSCLKIFQSYSRTWSLSQVVWISRTLVSDVCCSTFVLSCRETSLSSEASKRIAKYCSYSILLSPQGFVFCSGNVKKKLPKMLTKQRTKVHVISFLASSTIVETHTRAKRHYIAKTHHICTVYVLSKVLTKMHPCQPHLLAWGKLKQEDRLWRIFSGIKWRDSGCGAAGARPAEPTAICHVY